MDFLAAFTAVEEVLLDVVSDCEESTARCVRCCVLAIRACDTLSDCGCSEIRISMTWSRYEIRARRTVGALKDSQD